MQQWCPLADYGLCKVGRVGAKNVKIKLRRLLKFKRIKDPVLSPMLCAHHSSSVIALVIMIARLLLFPEVCFSRGKLSNLRQKSAVVTARGRSCNSE